MFLKPREGSTPLCYEPFSPGFVPTKFTGLRIEPTWQQCGYSILVADKVRFHGQRVTRSHNPLRRQTVSMRHSETANNNEPKFELAHRAARLAGASCNTRPKRYEWHPSP